MAREHAPINVTNTSGYVRVPVLTTVQKAALAPLAGMLVYDSNLARLEVYTGTVWEPANGILYDALKRVSATGKVSILHLRPAGVVTGTGTITDRGPVINFGTGATTNSTAYTTTYPGGAFGNSEAVLNFSKPFAVQIPIVRGSAQAETSGRFMVRGTSGGAIAPVDAVHWGIEICFLGGNVQLLACKLGAGGVLTSGAPVAYTQGNVFELTHDPAVGCSLLSGVTFGSLAVLATIALAADYPIADSADGVIAAGISRVGGADVATRDFFFGRSCVVKYNGG